MLPRSRDATATTVLMLHVRYALCSEPPAMMARLTVILLIFFLWWADPARAGVTCDPIGSATYPTVVEGESANLPDALVPPLQLPVVVQMLVTDELCYSASYSGPGVKQNDARRFQAKADSQN